MCLCGTCALVCVTHQQQQQQSSLHNLQTMYVPSRRAGVEDIWWWTHAAGSSKESTAMQEKAIATGKKGMTHTIGGGACLHAHAFDNDHSRKLKPHRQQCVGVRTAVHARQLHACARHRQRNQGSWQVHASGPAWELWGGVGGVRNCCCSVRQQHAECGACASSSFSCAPSEGGVHSLWPGRS